MSELDRAIHLLLAGKLVAFPTETVYGLGADATQADAVARIFAAKGRPANNPLICHVAGAAVARRYAAEWPAEAQALADAFWPGPVTIVVLKTDAIVSAATAGGSTVGLRAPDHPLTLELLRRFDRPLAGPSANRSTHVSPTTAGHVRDEFGDAVDLILDGGPCRVGIESTVVDVIARTILRPGGVSRQQIEAVIGPVKLHTETGDGTSPARSPGQLPVHYAPRTPTYRFEAHQQPRLPDNAAILPCRGAPAEYAHCLYASLRALDAKELEAIYVEMPPDKPEWLAVRDRLLRATRALTEAG